MAQISRHLRNENRVRVYKCLMAEEVSSRADIARKTGMSGPTVMRIIDELLENQLVFERETDGHSIGRKPIGVSLQSDFACQAAVIHEGDLVRVDRVGGGRGMVRKAVRRAVRVARASAAAGRRRAGASDDAELEEQLRKFVFYVNVKHIEPTYIEVYHNKKRPDETIRLNW